MAITVEVCVRGKEGDSGILAVSIQRSDERNNQIAGAITVVGHLFDVADAPGNSDGVEVAVASVAVVHELI